MKHFRFVKSCWRYLHTNRSIWIVCVSREHRALDNTQGNTSGHKSQKWFSQFDWAKWFGRMVLCTFTQFNRITVCNEAQKLLLARQLQVLESPGAPSKFAVQTWHCNHYGDYVPLGAHVAKDDGKQITLLMHRNKQYYFCQFKSHYFEEKKIQKI